MPPQPETLLAGNVAVSLGPDGAPMATLSHPEGATCQARRLLAARGPSWSWAVLEGDQEQDPVSLPGCRVISWKSSAGPERLPEGGALMPCGLEGTISPSDWTIESLVGLTDGFLSFSAFAEARTPEGVPVCARALVQLWRDGISLGLEVSHAGFDDMECEEDGALQEEAPEPSAKRSRMLPLKLPDAGLHGLLRCQGPPVISQETTAVGSVNLEQAGAQVATTGFSVLKLLPGPESLQFRALAPAEVVLRPGETVSGSFQVTAS
ncbi:unnamed protein product [Effrenium voratum]|nr:unnamed protein product [Effrenium voratum]